MLIILLEFTLILFLTSKLKKQGVQRITVIVALALLVQALILFAYRIELSLIGREVYYSDAEVYWRETKFLLAGGKLTTTQIGYATFCALIQKTSFVRSVLWNNISNIFLLDIAVLLIGKTMADQDVDRKNIRGFITICVFNPLVIYSLARNLKDALFLFLVVCIVYCYLGLSGRGKLIKIALIAVLTAFISMIRPWGFLIIIFLLLEKLFSGTKRSVIKRLIIFAVLFSAAFLLVRHSRLWFHVELWAPIVFEQGASQSLLGLLIAPLKALTGPGPLHSILGHDYFLFYTYTGNVFSAIGALMWWWNLSCFIIRFRKPVWRPVSICFGLIWLFFLFVYSMLYGGSLELRFRGVVYVLTSAMVYPTQPQWLRQRANINSVAFFCIIAVLGTIFSM